MNKELVENVIILNIYFDDCNKDTIVVKKVDLHEAEKIIANASEVWYGTENPEKNLHAESSYSYLYQCLDKANISYTSANTSVEF